MDENYLSPTELRGIADACEALLPLWELLTNGPVGGIQFDQGDEATVVYCYDESGKTVGFISWSEVGPSFFLHTDKD